MNAILGIVYMALYMPLGFVIGWLAGNPIIRGKIMNKAVRYNRYGLVVLKGLGKHLRWFVKRIDTGTIKIDKIDYPVLHDKVYNSEYGDVKISKDGTIEIDPKKFYYVAGLPTIFIDVNDLIPLELAREVEVHGIRDPKLINVLIQRESEAKSLEAMKFQKKKLLQYIIIAMLLVGIVLIVNIIGFINISKILQLVQAAKGG